ncbi:methylcobalamin:coenzyme M methyltransferase [Lentilactobacillus sunkii]|jgi:uroporphyrinogen decarboxylase|uniref:Methylcobalamin:coenzyme M methyltransferase n=1 Tax=Lentilactobacillus sunkii TaxID=481719 RepID=A0A1E7XHH7_9LACO|nr:uroporphyrinogen decarboxylase family protein [Lentilactobacillus sunkii]OFA12575.1 methylcobalamin:coenzyme M methyltransferase [Lentilactobacillus sunkii]
MNKAEVLKAFYNQNELQVPFSVWHHFTPNEHVESTANNGMYDTDLDQESKFVNAVRPDFIKLMNDGYFTYQLNNVDNPRDLKSLTKIKPILDDDIWLKEQARLISAQIESIDDPTVVLSNVFSAVTLLKWKLVSDEPEIDLSQGDVIFADLYTKDPEAVINALRVINADIKKQIRAQHSAGIDGVLFSTQEIQDDRIGQEFFETVQRKLDAELISEINGQGEIGILHVCGFGEATNHLPWFADYDLPVVNWATRVDGYTLGEGKQLFKDEVVFGGLGITKDDVLYKGTKEEIQSEVRRLIDEVGTKGVIIGADCTIQRDTPVEHIRWAAEAAHNYIAVK